MKQAYLLRSDRHGRERGQDLRRDHKLKEIKEEEEERGIKSFELKTKRDPFL